MAPSRWRGVITLIPKEDSDTLANWRPITLNGKDLQIDQTPLKTVLSRGKSVCKDNKLREFYFKLLHRIEVTKKELLVKCPRREMNEFIISTHFQ